MYNKITVPLDGSILAEQAVPFALRLTERLGAELQLVRIATHEKLVGEKETGQENDAAKARQYLVNVCIKFAKEKVNLPGGIETIVSHSNSPSSTDIAIEINRPQTDLIVMATHSRSGIARLALGSVAIATVKQANVPVLLFHPSHNISKDTAQIPFAEDGDILLLTLDGSTGAETVLAPAIDLAVRLKLNINLLYVVIPGVPLDFQGGIGYTPEIDLVKLQEKASEYLTTIQNRLEGQGLNVHKLVRVGNAAEEIIKYSEEIQPSLIAMATHARGRVGQMLIGSTAESVTRATNRPILFVHEGVTPEVKTPKHVLTII